MKRIGRAHFALVGVPATINALAMLVVSFNSTFRIGSGYTWLLPLTVALACLALATVCAIRRGRDLGWAPVSTLAAFVLCILFGPVVLLILALLAFMPPRPAAAQFGPPPRPVGPVTSLGALVLAGAPWLFALLAKLV